MQLTKDHLQPIKYILVHVRPDPKIWNQVTDQIWDQVGNQVKDQVWGQVGNPIKGQVWDQVWESN